MIYTYIHIYIYIYIYIISVPWVTSFRVNSFSIICCWSKKMYGKIKIKFKTFYLALRLSTTNIEVIISLEKF